jgi:hypothetical protein
MLASNRQPESTGRMERTGADATNPSRFANCGVVKTACADFALCGSAEN